MTDPLDKELAASDQPDLPPEFDQEASDLAAVEADELDDSLDDAVSTDDELDAGDVFGFDEERRRRGSRLAPMRTRIVDHLRRTQADDAWQPWPEVVEAIDIKHRTLAEISPINGRMRQAALALWRDGLLDIKYGQYTVYEAVRLTPAGYTDD